MAKKRDHGDIGWHLPGKGKPFAYSPVATRDCIRDMANDGGTVKECRDRMGMWRDYLPDPEIEKILDYYIEHGYGDVNAKALFCPTFDKNARLHAMIIKGETKYFSGQLGSGILDEQKNEIFEGDTVEVIRYGKKYPGQIYIQDGCFYVAWQDDGFHYHASFNERAKYGITFNVIKHIEEGES